MCRIISFVSAVGGVGKSSIIKLLAEGLAGNKKKVCVIDGVFALNSLSEKLKNKTSFDLSGYLRGNVNYFSVLNKVNDNLYFVKTDDSRCDYYLKGELIEKFIQEISCEFDYILIETSSYDIRNMSLFLNMTNEVFFIITQDNEVIRNSFKLIQKLYQFKNLKNIKLILNKQKVISEINGKVLSEDYISKIFKIEVIFCFPKFLKNNIFENKNTSSMLREFMEKFALSVVSNNQIKTNYNRQYHGFIGKIKQKLYAKYE